MLTTSRIICAVVVTLALTGLASAKTINYQGYLKDGAGAPVSVSVPMAFSLYTVDAGGTPLWTEIQTVLFNINNPSPGPGLILIGAFGAK